jgi:hypothetical protein
MARHGQTVSSLLLAATLASAALGPAASAETRALCRQACGDQIAVCIGASLRGPSAAQRICRRAVRADCRREGLVACPPIDRVEFATEVAAAAGRATVCSATLPDVAVGSLEEAAAVGQTVAATLLGTSAETLRALRRCGPARFCPAAFAKIVGAAQARPMLGFFRVVAVAARGRTYTYSGEAGRVTAIVGRKGGRAFGLAITSARPSCALPP